MTEKSAFKERPDVVEKPPTPLYATLSMANLVTALRLLLLFLFAAWIYWAPPFWQLANPAILGLIFLLDAVDGLVARRRGESSTFGAVFDIAADRVVENVLWLVLVDLGWAPVWVAIVFITRGLLVDALRGAQGGAPFDVTRSPLGRFLVKGRFMRFTYAFVKFLAFAFLLTLIPLAAVYPEAWNSHRDWLQPLADSLVYLAVALCLLRGAPVLTETLLAGLGVGRESGSHGSRAD